MAAFPKLAFAAAVASPLCLLAVAGTWFSADAPRVKPPHAVEFEELLARLKPGMVFVGNSKVGTDLKPPDVATGLEYRKRAVALTVPGSGAPAWYAVLEQRVFDNGHKPELIVVYSTLASLLRCEVGSAKERQLLDEQLTRESDVLQAKVFGGGGESGRRGRARRRATSVHQTGLDGLRNFAVGLAVAPTSDASTTERGRSHGAAALDVVFGQKAMFRKGKTTRAVPVAEELTTNAMLASDISPQQGLIPDIVSLAKANGARVLFVRAPVPAASREMDDIEPALERAALELINELGAGWIDLRDLALPVDAFRDDMHMGANGRAATTAALVDRMKAANVLGGTMPVASMPVAPTAITREGVPPAISLGKGVPRGKAPCAVTVVLPTLGAISEDALGALGIARASPVVVSADSAPLAAHAPRKAFGESCAASFFHTPHALVVSPPSMSSVLTAAFADTPFVTDDAGEEVWWVYPSTSLVFRFDEPWNRGPLTAHLRARTIGGTVGSIELAGTTAPLAAQGRLTTADLAADAPVGAWSIRVAAGPETFLVLEHLRLGETSPVDIIGSPPADLQLLGAIASWAEPPADLAASPARTTGSSPRTVSMPALAHVSDNVTTERLGAACSPVRIARPTAPDEWIRSAHMKELDLKAGQIAFGHWGEHLSLAPSSAEMPETEWRVGLDPHRTCSAATWLYPGDRLNLLLRGDNPSRLHLGADRLTLVAAAFRSDTAATSEVQVAIRKHEKGAPGTLLYEGKAVFSASGPPETVILEISPALPPRARLDIEFSLPDDASFVAIASARLSESESAPAAESSP